ncbi:uncharacterized protein LOC141856230 [Brevipalpus obovatus]|uniref:uncharacterized protein LOC141856230 n=1 Tax=Brevipalpus obovatus TaxID=246614 RepID=UPI003D9F2077
MGVSILFFSIGFLAALCSIQGSKALVLGKSDLKFACKAYKESGGKLDQTRIKIEQHLREQKVEESAIKKASAKIAELIKILVDGFFSSFKGQSFLTLGQLELNTEDDIEDELIYEEADEESNEEVTEESNGESTDGANQKSTDEQPQDQAHSNLTSPNQLPSDKLPSDELLSDGLASGESSDQLSSDELLSGQTSVDTASPNQSSQNQPESNQIYHPFKPVVDTITNLVFSSRNICDMLQFPLFLNINDTPQKLISQILDQPRM